MPLHELSLCLKTQTVNTTAPDLVQDIRTIGLFSAEKIHIIILIHIDRREPSCLEFRWHYDQRVRDAPVYAAVTRQVNV